jgi:hypothetical protein
MQTQEREYARMSSCRTVSVSKAVNASSFAWAGLLEQPHAHTEMTDALSHVGLTAVKHILQNRYSTDFLFHKQLLGKLGKPNGNHFATVHKFIFSLKSDRIILQVFIKINDF